MMNKKGNAIIDTMVVMVILAILAVVVVVANYIFDIGNQAIQSDSDMAASSKVHTAELYAAYPSVFDGIFTFILIASWISALIFSFMIDTNPIFLVISLIVMAVVLFIAALLANNFSDVMSIPELATFAVNYPAINFVMSHLVEIMLAIGASITIALFAKSRL